MAEGRFEFHKAAIIICMICQMDVTKPGTFVPLQHFNIVYISGYVASNRGREFVLAFMTNWDAFKGTACQVAITTHCAGVVSVNVTVPLLSQVRIV